MSAHLSPTPCPAASVLVLFAYRRPSAIAWLIVTVVVDSVERHAAWLFTHIFQKRWEVIAPFFAHGYPATAVILKGLALRVVTSSLGVIPCLIFNFIVSPEVVLGVFTDKFCPSMKQDGCDKAPATLDMAYSQVTPKDIHAIAASAQAFPHSALLVPFQRRLSSAFDCQKPNRLSGHVYSLHARTLSGQV